MQNTKRNPLKLTRIGYFAVLTATLTTAATLSLMVLQRDNRVADYPVIIFLIGTAIVTLVHYYLSPGKQKEKD